MWDSSPWSPVLPGTLHLVCSSQLLAWSLQALQFASPGPESGRVSLGNCFRHRRFLNRLKNKREWPGGLGVQDILEGSFLEDQTVSS